MAAPQPPPGYIDPDAPQPPPGYIAMPAAPADSSMSWEDLGRAAMTVGVRGPGALLNALADPLHPLRQLISPDLERVEQSGRLQPGTAAGNAIFGVTGVPEYQPTTGPGRTGMAALTGAAAGLPFGPVAAALGALGGGAGQAVQDIAGRYMSPQNAERAGVLAGIAAPGGVGLARRAFGEPRAAVPTATELQASGAEGFNEARRSPVATEPSSVADLGRDVYTDLTRGGPAGGGGFRRSSAPNSFDILGEMMDPAAAADWRMGGGAPYQFADLHALRRQLQQTITDNQGFTGNRSEVAAAAQTLRNLDQYIENLPANPGHLASGTPAEAADLAETFRNARGDYAAAQRSNAVTGELNRARTGIEERAEGRAAAANSGLNLDNTLRRGVESLLENRKSVLGFSDAELAALDRVVNPGMFSPRNAARFTSNLLGGGGGLGALASAGAGLSTAALTGRGLLGALGMGIGLPGTGLLARNLQNTLGRRALRSADETIRMNSPLYRERLAGLPLREDAIIPSLMMGLLSQQR